VNWCKFIVKAGFGNVVGKNPGIDSEEAITFKLDYLSSGARVISGVACFLGGVLGGKGCMAYGSQGEGAGRRPLRM